MTRLNVQSKSNKGPPEQLSETHLKTKQVLNDYLTKEQQCHVRKHHRENCPQTKHSTCGEGLHSTYWPSPQILSINVPTTFNPPPPQHSLHCSLMFGPVQGQPLGSEQSSLLAEADTSQISSMSMCIPTHKSAEHDDNMHMTNHACHWWPCGLEPDLTGHRPSLIQ